MSLHDMQGLTTAYVCISVILIYVLVFGLFGSGDDDDHYPKL